MPKIDYPSVWYEEISQRWVKDFILDESFFKEVNAYIREPDGDEENSSSNFIFEIEFQGETVRLYVFYDWSSNQIVEVESLDTHNFDIEQLAKQIYQIDQRWLKQKTWDILKS